jgi:hypothetical protein
MPPVEADGRHASQNIQTPKWLLGTPNQDRYGNDFWMG